MTLPPGAGPVLTGWARTSIDDQLAKRSSSAPTHAWLEDEAASFVTLTADGRLRGCIGSLRPHRRLVDDVAANAVAAAVHDPRFPPVKPEELPGLHVEVSVLSPLELFEVTSEDDLLAKLRPGVDGLVIAHGKRRATFLPQVWDQLPQPELFLAHLKRKAGFADDWWDEGVRLQRYTVTEFEEALP
ncbi:AmmeMemoRadiSam system protein A [Aestuariimicrobium ganziense]|uniref:AmmeMemoRadiSam system protein A n=1 Tax=Aestuariimicrobium ganziense TaxID=2773677 RepID=UPI0019409CBA|nr:AmmeMemoRadiSam system protein A [Aestuariimicrobium ganziense]